MNYGIKDDYWKRLETVFVSHKNIEKGILYGSRAKGTNRMYSDVDIVLVGEKINNREYTNIIQEIDDLLLPFIFDISVYHSIKDSNLIESINRTGVIIYENNSLVFLK
ncbi:MAG: nucleotidyltransferase domain-containing protein [Bacteroidales bacterium]|nr:nucleotidyltransferase domain-containing protein [Bacteroidales bacterium]